MKKTKLPLLILEADSGESGIELLTTSTDTLNQQFPGIRTPITLFLDINMPLMNGWQFVEELERRGDEIQLHPTVVLMYSTSDDSVDKEKAKGYATVSNYIVKGDSSPESIREAILRSNTQAR